MESTIYGCAGIWCRDTRRALFAWNIADGHVVDYLGVVGNPLNDDGGGTFAPLLTYGLVAAPASLRDLGRAVAGRAGQALVAS